MASSTPGGGRAYDGGCSPRCRGNSGRAQTVLLVVGCGDGDTGVCSTGPKLCRVEQWNGDSVPVVAASRHGTVVGEVLRFDYLHFGAAASAEGDEGDELLAEEAGYRHLVFVMFLELRINEFVWFEPASYCFQRRRRGQ